MILSKTYAANISCLGPMAGRGFGITTLIYLCVTREGLSLRFPSHQEMYGCITKEHNVHCYIQSLSLTLELNSSQFGIATSYCTVTEFLSIKTTFALKWMELKQLWILLSDDLSSPEGLAIDWISRNVYWTDSGMDRIEVSKLDGKQRKVLFDTDLVNPRAIVVDAANG